MKSLRRSFTMSTDKRKKKPRIPRVERIKIIEYGCIGLVIALFLGLAIFYGGKARIADIPEAEAVSSPVPTDDRSIRGKKILDAIEVSSFRLSYQQDHYDLVSQNNILIEMRMQSDDTGLQRLSFETPLCADPDDEGTIADTVKEQNRNTVEALRDLLDLIMPVLRRNVSDSDTIVKRCTEVVKSGEPYSKHMGQFTVRIHSDPDEIPQTVVIEWIRDP